jgi:hypothetical protein
VQLFIEARREIAIHRNWQQPRADSQRQPPHLALASTPQLTGSARLSPPKDIRKSIGGWASADLASRCGERYSLQVMREWLERVEPQHEGA